MATKCNACSGFAGKLPQRNYNAVHVNIDSKSRLSDASARMYVTCQSSELLADLTGSHDERRSLQQSHSSDPSYNVKKGSSQLIDMHYSCEWLVLLSAFSHRGVILIILFYDITCTKLT